MSNNLTLPSKAGQGLSTQDRQQIEAAVKKSYDKLEIWIGKYLASRLEIKREDFGAALCQWPDDLLLDIKTYFEHRSENLSWPEAGLRIFVSHRSTERERLAVVRSEVRSSNANFFLAHDDIQEGEKWSPALIDALEEMDAFVSVHSQGYAESPACNQEAGFALARGVPRYAVLDGEAPCGFLSEDQGNAWKDDPSIAKNIIEKFLGLEKLGDRRGEGIACALLRSDSYDETRTIIRKLSICHSISQEAVHDIQLAWFFNSQVYGCAHGENNIRSILRKFGYKLRPLPLR